MNYVYCNDILGSSFFISPQNYTKYNSFKKAHPEIKNYSQVINKTKGRATGCDTAAGAAPAQACGVGRGALWPQA